MPLTQPRAHRPAFVHTSPSFAAPAAGPTSISASPRPAPAPVFAEAAIAVETPPERPAPMHVAQPMDNPTRPAVISWDRLHPPENVGERTLLQRVTPVHMGVLLVTVLVMMVVTSGPAAMSAKPTALPALATGGGSGVEVLPTHAGSTAVAAAAANAPVTKVAPRASPGGAARTTPRVRAAIPSSYLRVGSARLARRVHFGGIPSPAAAANLAVAGGGRAPAGMTDAVQMRGIPSSAASEALGPETLPFRPSDGVTLPRSFGERDSHAVEDNYGTGVLPMEAPVELPAMTPGQSAANAEARVTRNQLTGDSSSAPVASGGLTTAF